MQINRSAENRTRVTRTLVPLEIHHRATGNRTQIARTRSVYTTIVLQPGNF